MDEPSNYYYTLIGPKRNMSSRVPGPAGIGNVTREDRVYNHSIKRRESTKYARVVVELSQGHCSST